MGVVTEQRTATKDSYQPGVFVVRHRHGKPGLIFALALDLVLAISSISPSPSHVRSIEAAGPLVPRTIHLQGFLSGIVSDAQTGRVFVAAWSMRSATPRGTVDVLDARTGLPVSTVAVGYVLTGIGADVRAGHVFVLDGAGGPYLGLRGAVSMLDARSGKVLHTATVGFDPQEIAVDTHTGRAFVLNTTDHTLSVLDTHSGALLRTVPAGPDAREIVADERTGRIFVADVAFTNEIRAFDAWTGEPLHTTSFGKDAGLDFGRAPAVDTRTGRVFVANSAYPSTVAILDGRTGLLQRTIPVREPVREVFGYAALAVDARSGRLFGVYPDASGSPVKQGAVDTFDASSGGLLHTTLAPVGSGSITVDMPRARVFVVSQGQADNTGHASTLGRVSVLDARTGALRCILTGGHGRRSDSFDPTGAVTIDEQSGHIFVFDRHQGTISVLDMTC